MRCLPFALLLLACADDPAASKGGDSVEPEPLNLPADLAENGVPVGVMTLEYEGLTVEVWYPAAESARAGPTPDSDDRAGKVPRQCPAGPGKEPSGPFRLLSVSVQVSS